MLHLVSNLENIFFSKLKSHLEYQSEVDDMNMKFRPHTQKHWQHGWRRLSVDIIEIFRAWMRIDQKVIGER